MAHFASSCCKNRKGHELHFHLLDLDGTAKSFFLGIPPKSHLGSSLLAAKAGRKQCISGKETSMELGMRLNVLAACMSFGFVVAVVFGLI